MPGTVTSIDTSEKLLVLGETLGPFLTNPMDSALEIFDTNGPDGAGPPPHCHVREEAYVVQDGELEGTVDGESHVLESGGVALVPSGSTHSDRNITETHFLTIVTRGEAAQFFMQVSNEVEVRLPDVPGVPEVAALHGIEFKL